MAFCRIVSLAIATAVLIPTAAAAQLDDEDFSPGLLARYTAGGKSVERVEADVSFVWDGDAPDVRLPAGPFSATWQGNLLMRREGTYRFHAYVQGRVSVSIDGKRALSAAKDDVGWVTGEELSLGFGETPLAVEFTKTGEAARLQLFWSSDSFGIEPIPGHLLFRDESSPKLAQIERGRLAFDAHRCNRCHVRDNDPPSPPASALTHVAARSRFNDPHAHIPAFGFDEQQAQAVAAFLANRTQPVELAPAGDVPEKDRQKERRQGEVLLRSTGCLACHTVGEEGHSGPFGGGDLADVGARRSPDWLNTWLSDPAKLNADHRMPDMKLSAAERRQLVLHLSSLRAGSPAAQDSPAAEPASEELIDKGRRLVEAARCAACHQIDGAKANLAGLPDLSQPVADWSNSCLSADADVKTGRPAYTRIDRDDVIAYVESRGGPLSPPGPFARGERVLERRNCLACHQRGGAKGILDVAGRMAQLDSDLQRKSEALIPPALNAIGDKLLDDALAEAVSGERKTPRMPWLTARMPKFKHSQQDKQDLLAYLIGHDRIPDGHDIPSPSGRGTASTAQPSKQGEGQRAAADAQTLVAGHTLIGPKGFSCIACHQVGSYVPRNVAPGTRGSDLMLLGKRMRREFYLRWTRSPARIVPGMEMPSYVKAVPNVLDGDVDRQLLATWDALNDPRFTPPTNPTAVEQFWPVKPGGPARIVRDVFTSSKENGGGYVARSLAIGLNNGHNVLFDLDTFSLRDWTFGDFARQRTQGKSWYWDMAGVPVMTGFQPASDFALLPKDEKEAKPIFPRREHGTSGRLLGYAADADGVVLGYWMLFEVDGEVHRLFFTETVRPLVPTEPGEAGGWTREIFISVGFGSKATDDHHVLISRPTVNESARSPRIEPSRSLDKKWFSLPDIKGREFLKLDVIAPGLFFGPTSRGTLHYTSPLKLEPGELNLKPAEPPQIERVTSTPGYDGVRLPISRAIMPTAMTFLPDGRLAFTSLKGDVYVADDSDGDGIEDRLTLFEEGLAAPFGIIADGDDLIVAHKPEVLRLRDSDGDGRADQRIVVATGWGYTDDYHDWTCGIVRDKEGNLYVGLGSDYAQKDRPKEQSRWRGDVLKIAPGGKITPVGHGFRYPTGLAITADGEIFVSDNQGVQNTFNEINHLVPGRRYGVPSRHEANPNAPATPPAIQVPHPWTRSVNGLFFLPLADSVGHPLGPFAGHGIGCEYDSRFLVRFTLQKVGDVMQGAVYHFSRPDAGAGEGEANFVGPLCGAVAPNGDVYIGSIYDSGWLGGQNTGAITRLRPNGKLPNGIRELRATAEGFEIEFLQEIDRTAAARAESYTISGYTRDWKGSYATPDSERHRADVESVHIAEDGRSVRLKVDKLREGFVYEVTCGRIGVDRDTPLWPATGHYTLHRIPR